MKTFILTIKMEVSENWIEDGFNPLNNDTQIGIQDALRENLLQYAYYGSEYKVNLISVNGQNTNLPKDEIQ